MGAFQIPAYTAFLLSIIVLVVVGVVVAYRLQQGAIEDDGSTDDDDLLKGFEKAYYMGEINAAEFKRVTEALEAKKLAEGGSRVKAKPPTPAVIIPPEEPQQPAETPPQPEPPAPEA